MKDEVLKKAAEQGKFLIPNENGILVEPDHLMATKKNLDGQQIKIEDHNKARMKEILAPIPNVKVPFSSILVKAVRPKMINTMAHMKMIHLDIEGDDKFKRDALSMVRTVYNEQEIVVVGSLVTEFAVGDLVRIDYRRFTNLRDTNESMPNGEYSKTIDVPIHNIDGHDYILIDQRDIVWVLNDNKQQIEAEEYAKEIEVKE